MAFTVVGYGPKSELFPFIPEFLILDSVDGNSYKLPENGSKVDSIGLDEQFEAILFPTEYKSDHWCIVEENRTLTWFPRQDRTQWLTKRAMSLVSEAKFKSNPLKSLKTLEAAAKLCGFDLQELLGFLESNRGSPTESLEQIFKRLNPKVPDHESGNNK